MKELETALEDSQRKLKYMESDHPWRDPSNYNTGPFSTQDSPIARDGHGSIDQPVTISLSGEPLTSYNEESTAKVSESDDEDLKIGFKNGSHDVGNGHADCRSACNGNQETVFDRRREEDVCSLSNDNACSSSSSRDGSEDGKDDEMERLLIMQIVEKAKQGSPAVLNAKRAFWFSNLEIEH